MAANSNLPRVSVVIPTHNPRMDYLARVIEGLRGQTLEQSAWELVVVDNNSQPPLRVAGLRDQKTKRPKDEESQRRKESVQQTEIDLSWHPNARVVRE